jgi:mannose-binding lectin 2
MTAEWNPRDFQKREHSLVKPFTGTGFGVPNWDFLGSTMVTSNYIRLTSDDRSKQGAIWNKIPCRVRNWEVQLSFKVSGTTRDLFGDGFAFWYAKERMTNGPVFGSKDYFSGLAIIADTYSNHNGPHNHNHPYLSAMLNNGSITYDHDRDGTHTMLGGCEVKFRNLEHDTVIAIRYEGDKLTVSHDLENRRVWEPCFALEGVVLPTGYYFGISATTGDLSDNHDLISLKTYELDTPEGVSKEERAGILPQADYVAAPRDHKDDPPPSMSGLKKFLLVLLALLGLVVCIVVGMMLYQNRQDNTRKRFY